MHARELGSPLERAQLDAAARAHAEAALRDKNKSEAEGRGKARELLDLSDMPSLPPILRKHADSVNGSVYQGVIRAAREGAPKWKVEFMPFWGTSDFIFLRLLSISKIIYFSIIQPSSDVFLFDFFFLFLFHEQKKITHKIVNHRRRSASRVRTISWDISKMRREQVSPMHRRNISSRLSPSQSTITTPRLSRQAVQTLRMLLLPKSVSLRTRTSKSIKEAQYNI